VGLLLANGFGQFELGKGQSGIFPAEQSGQTLSKPSLKVHQNSLSTALCKI